MCAAAAASSSKSEKNSLRNYFSWSSEAIFLLVDHLREISADNMHPSQTNNTRLQGQRWQGVVDRMQHHSVENVEFEIDPTQPEFTFPYANVTRDNVSYMWSKIGQAAEKVLKDSAQSGSGELLFESNCFPSAWGENGNAIIKAYVEMKEYIQSYKDEDKKKKEEEEEKKLNEAAVVRDKAVGDVKKVLVSVRPPKEKNSRAAGAAAPVGAQDDDSRVGNEEAKESGPDIVLVKAEDKEQQTPSKKRSRVPNTATASSTAIVQGLASAFQQRDSARQQEKLELEEKRLRIEQERDERRFTHEKEMKELELNNAAAAHRHELEKLRLQKEVLEMQLRLQMQPQPRPYLQSPQTLFQRPQPPKVLPSKTISKSPAQSPSSSQ